MTAESALRSLLLQKLIVVGEPLRPAFRLSTRNTGDPPANCVDLPASESILEPDCCGRSTSDAMSDNRYYV